MLEKHGIACDMMHGFSWSKWVTGKPAERLALIPAGQEHILEQEDGKKRWVQVVTELSRAFALCAASDEATEIRDDVSFFQALQAALNKQNSNNRKTPEQIDAASKRGEDLGLTDDEVALTPSLPLSRAAPGASLGLSRSLPSGSALRCPRRQQQRGAGDGR